MNSLRKRWSIGLTLCTSTLCLASAQLAAAQTLDLSGPASPAAGRGYAALELASRLERDAERLLDTDEPDPLQRRRAAARAAVRAAASALAQLGESLGGDGSPAVLWAMTIDTRLEGIDAAIGASSDAALLASIASDFRELELAWSRGAAVSAETIDAQIASGFAQLTIGLPSRPGAGWFVGARSAGVGNGSPAAAADELDVRLDALRDSGVGDAAISSLATYAGDLRDAAEWTAYARRASHESARLTAAIDGLLGLPAGTPGPARQRLAADLAEAVSGEGDTALLDLIAAHARVFSALDRMEPGREADRLIARAGDAIASRQADAAGSVAAAELAAETLETSVSRSDVRRDDHLTRVVRPAWRALVPRVRGVTVNARDEAVTLLLDPDRVTDPGVLATIAQQRSLFRDFGMLERISSALERGLGGSRSIDSAVSDRVLAIGQTMRTDDDFEDSIGLLRSFDAQRRVLERLEANRRAAARVMGAKGSELPDRIGGLRNAWLNAWAIAGGNGPDDALLDDLRMVDQLVRLLADAEGFTRLGAIDAWPGLEFTPRAIRVLTDGLTEGIDGLVPDAMRAGNAVARDRSLTRIVTLRGDYAAALLAGRLSRLGEQAGLVQATAIEEVALGPPVDGSWMAEHRGVLADVSRYADELARAVVERRDETAEVAPLRSLVAWRSLRLLEQLEAAGSAGGGR